MDNSAYLILVVVTALALFVYIKYNHLVVVRNHCREAWANIDTELKRRYDLIPQLVATAKGYMVHERETLEEITKLRSLCRNDTGSPIHQAESENLLIDALEKILVQIENYPELKANENFLSLQNELVTTENRIQAARRFYNGNVRELNNLVQQFPGNLIAASFGFAQGDYFKIHELHVRAAPTVTISDN